MLELRLQVLQQLELQTQLFQLQQELFVLLLQQQKFVMQQLTLPRQKLIELISYKFPCIKNSVLLSTLGKNVDIKCRY